MAMQTPRSSVGVELRQTRAILCGCIVLLVPTVDETTRKDAERVDFLLRCVVHATKRSDFITVGSEMFLFLLPGMRGLTV